MAIVGEAFIVISPEGASARTFATKLDAELKGSNFGATLDKQLANAGVTSGNSFVGRFVKSLKIGGLEGGQVLGIGVATAAIAGLGAIGASFQKVRSQIQQETGATGRDLTVLADDVTTAFRHVPVSLSQAADAVDELRRRGEPLGPQLENLAQQELFLAKITKSEVAPTVDATTALFSKYNVATADQSRELDVLFKATQQSGKGLDVLLSGLTSGAASLQKFGFNLDTSTALLATLEKEGFNVAPALAALRLGFGKIAQEGGDPVRVLHALVEELTNGKDPAKGMADAIHLFGTRSGVELATAIQKGALSAGGLIKIITDGRKGIIETGLSTLTLGDQFRLLRNNAEADLSHIGTVVIHDLEDVLKAASGPTESLATGFGHLLVAVAPVAEAFPLFLVPLRVALPVVSAFGQGLDAIAKVVGLIPGPVLAIGSAVAVVALVATGAADGLLAATGAATAFGVAVDFATGPIGIAIGAVALLGHIVHQFGEEDKTVAKDAKLLGDALFVTNNSTTLLAGGVRAVTSGLQSYLKSADGAKTISGDVRKALEETGGTSTTLAKQVAGSTTSWDAYVKAVVAGAAKHDVAIRLSINAGNQYGSASQQLIKHLNDQRDAFQKQSKETLDNAVTNGILKQSEVDLAVQQTKNTDGSNNYASAIDRLNKQLQASADKHNANVAAARSTASAESDLAKQIAAGTLSDKDATAALGQLGFVGGQVAVELARLKLQAEALNEVQDRSATNAAKTSFAYAELARGIATGNVVEGTAIQRLEAMGFTAGGAKTQFSALQQAISSFVDTATGAIPGAGKVIDDLAQQAKTDASNFQQDLTQQASLQRQLLAQQQTHGTAAAKSLQSVNAKLAEDERNIADGSVHTTNTLDHDLNRRTTILQTASTEGGKASASLTLAIQANNAKIHKDYAKLVADNDPAKFTKVLVANTVQTAQFMKNLQTLVTEGFGELAGQLALKGPEAAASLASGFASDAGKAKIANAAVELGQETTNKYTAFLKQNFPALSLATSQLGSTVGKGMAKGLTAELLKEFPQLKAIGVGVGETVGDGIAPGIESHFTKQQQQLITYFKTHGGIVGSSFVDGLAAGVSDSTANAELIKRINKMADGAIAQARKDFRSHSPSLVFYDIGTDVVHGLAAGITATAAAPATAFTRLASSGAATFSETLAKGLADGAAAATSSGSALDRELVKIDKQWRAKFHPVPFRPGAAPSDLLASALAITGQTGTTRADALVQQQRAQQPRLPNPVANPPIFGAGAFTFNEKVDPLHVAAEIAWQIRHGVG